MTMLYVRIFPLLVLLSIELSRWMHSQIAVNPSSTGGFKIYPSTKRATTASIYTCTPTRQRKKSYRFAVDRCTFDSFTDSQDSRIPVERGTRRGSMLRGSVRSLAIRRLYAWSDDTHKTAASLVEPSEVKRGCRRVSKRLRRCRRVPRIWV